MTDSSERFRRSRQSREGSTEPSVLVLQLALPPYRQAFLDRIEAVAPEITFLTGDAQFLRGVTAGVESSSVESTGKNIFMLGRRLAWQRTGLRRLLASRILVVELNPRIVNSWVALIGRKLLKRKTIVWGHVFPRSGPASRSDRVRAIQRRLAHGAIVYTDREADAFRRLHPAKPVVVASNAIYSASAMVPVRRDDASSFLVIGRLVEDKGPLLALDAFHASGPPEGSSLIYVGAGPLEQEIRKRVRELQLDGCVEILGEIHELARLKEVFSRSVATVVAGYAGLNITQSIGFGVPVVLGPNPRHAPEIEAADSGNSVIFDGATVASLATAIGIAWRDRHRWLELSETISSSARERYSAESMADAFAHVLAAGADQ